MRWTVLRWYVLVRTLGPGFGLWLFPNPPRFSERQRPWWRRRWWRLGPVAVALLWGLE